MRILIIQHTGNEDLRLIEEVLLERGWIIDIVCMDIPGQTIPETIKGHDAFLILGGPMGAYEEHIYPYLYRVQELILEAAAQRIPTVGICLGSQLIARAFGAEVAPNPVKELGWYPVNLTSAGLNDRMFAGLPEEMMVFQWHQDTFALPEGAQLLARGNTCLNQAFLIGENMWALQFHPEVDLELINQWVEAGAEEVEEFQKNTAANPPIIISNDKWEQMRNVRENLLSNLEKVLHNR